LFSVEGVSREIGPGDSVYIPANAVHGARVLEDGTVAVDAFTPQREDFLE
jgi:quercetin dioxygenase-like cupin family protein